MEIGKIIERYLDEKDNIIRDLEKTINVLKNEIEESKKKLNDISPLINMDKLSKRLIQDEEYHLEKIIEEYNVEYNFSSLVKELYVFNLTEKQKTLIIEEVIKRYKKLNSEKKGE